MCGADTFLRSALFCGHTASSLVELPLGQGRARVARPSGPWNSSDSLGFRAGKLRISLDCPGLPGKAGMGKSRKISENFGKSSVFVWNLTDVKSGKRITSQTALKPQRPNFSKLFQSSKSQSSKKNRSFQENPTNSQKFRDLTVVEILKIQSKSRKIREKS